MFIFAHLFAGLIIGKLFGDSYLVALVGSFFLDLDHLIPYAKHKVLFKPRKILKRIISHKPYEYQRNFLHSFISWAIISAIIFAVDFNVGVVFSLAYITHLVFDLMDNADFYPLYPFKWNLKGPIGYFSKAEMVITLLLLVVFLLI